MGEVTSGQGISAWDTSSLNYTTFLADTCASRLFTNTEAGIAPKPELLETYQRYRAYLSDAQAQPRSRLRARDGD